MTWATTRVRETQTPMLNFQGQSNCTPMKNQALGFKLENAAYILPSILLEMVLI